MPDLYEFTVEVRGFAMTYRIEAESEPAARQLMNELGWKLERGIYDVKCIDD